MANLTVDGGWKIHTEVDEAFQLHITVSNEDKSKIYHWDSCGSNSEKIIIGFTTLSLENEMIKKS